ncbi:hypothetical protein [Paraglaciecola aestuariivivens]
MNVAKVLAALKRAKKYKVLLPYHAWDSGGINVPSDDVINVEQFLALFLKLIKEHKVEAIVSRYGHLTLFCPPFGEPVSINISRHWPQTLLENINTCGVFKSNDSADLHMPLVLQFRVMRNRTKSHNFSLNNIEKNAPYLANQLVQKIIEHTHKYPQPSTRLLPIQGYCLSINDVLAVSRYGHAKFKTNSAFVGINHFVDKHYALDSIKFSGNEVVMKTSFFYQKAEQAVYLRKRDFAMLRKFLPDLPLGNNITHEIFKLGKNER